jgi:hypothetical protein
VLSHKTTRIHFSRVHFSHSLALSENYAGSVSASEQVKSDRDDALHPTAQDVEAVEEHLAPNSLVEAPLEVSSGFSVGTILEAEMMDPRFPNYKDTIHPVEVVAIQDDGLGLGIKGFTKDFEKRCRDKKTGKINKQTPHIIP